MLYIPHSPTMSVKDKAFLAALAPRTFSGFSADPAVRACLDAAYKLAEKNGTFAAANSARSQYLAAETPLTVNDNNDLYAQSIGTWKVVSNILINPLKQILAGMYGRNVMQDFVTWTPPGVEPTVQVPIINSVGQVYKNPTSWMNSNLDTSLVNVTLTRYSCPAAMTTYDLLYGNRFGELIGALAEAVAQQIMRDYCAAMAAALPTTTADDSNIVAADGKINLWYLENASAITPDYVTKTLGPVFGNRGDVERLVLTPEAYAYLVPTNALSLTMAPGAYGIGEILRSAQITNADNANSAIGYGLRKDGIVYATGMLNIDAIAATNCDIKPLFEIAGIQLYAKTWSFPGDERFYMSVEAYAGFNIGNPADVVVISPINKSAA